MKERVSEKLWMEVHDIQETGIKTIPKKKKFKKAVLGGLINIYEKKRSERQRRKEKLFPFEYRVPKKIKKKSLPQ